MSTRTLALAVALIAATALPAEAQERERERDRSAERERKGERESRARRASEAGKSGKLDWGPGPPSLPAGARMAVLNGDPSKAGPFTVMLDLPPRYVIRPHLHPTDEHVMVREGQFRYGMGDRIDERSLRTLHSGQDVTLPANMSHYVVTRGRTVVAISAMGPFQITYVNPGDAPR